MSNPRTKIRKLSFNDFFSKRVLKIVLFESIFGFFLTIFSGETDSFDISCGLLFLMAGTMIPIFNLQDHFWFSVISGVLFTAVGIILIARRWKEIVHETEIV
jgi:hypothetical protein